MGAVVGSFDVNPTHSFNSVSLLILVQMTTSACGTSCGLQQSVVWAAAIMRLVQ